MSYETEVQSRPLSEATNTVLLINEKKTQLAPSLKSAAVFKCPGDRSYAIREGTRHPRVRSYSMNEYVGESDRVSAQRQNSAQGAGSFQQFSPDAIGRGPIAMREKLKKTAGSL